jgi:tetratricopeptide (TPR) repeat protein
MVRSLLGIGLFAALTATMFAASARDVDPALKEKALALNSITKDENADKKLRELFRDKPGTKKLVSAALELHKEGGKNSPFKPNATIILAKAAHGVKDYGSAETFYEYTAERAVRLQDEKRLAQSYLGIIQLYMTMKEYGKAEMWCEKYMGYEGGREIEQGRLGVLEMHILAIAKQGENDKALEKVEALTQLDGIGWVFYELKAKVQYEAGKVNDAIQSQKEFIEKIDDQDREPADKRALWKKQAQYLLSGYLVDANKVDEAVKLLRQLKEDDSENPTVYNDLGFVMADHDMNLEESEQLVRKALELDEKRRQKALEKKEIDEVEAKQKSAAYLDSLGWVLYKMKKYDEAKKYLLEATKDEDDGNHIEIWDHLADTHMALGEVKNAVDTWTKALKLEDVSKKDTERRKKITEKLKKAKEQLNKK